MHTSYRFGAFGDGIILTNDTGNYQIVSKQEFTAFSRNQLNPESMLYRQLQEKFFIWNGTKENYYRETEEAILRAHMYLLSPTSLFILAVTNQCNNNCVYCQANGGAAYSKMSIDTAELIIDRIAESPSKNITIEFQGGEPLLNFQVIKATIIKAEKKLVDKNVEFCIVSNLILLTDEIAQFFKQHSVSVSTSLDGPKDLHDWNRPRVNGDGSFDAVVKGLAILRNHGLNAGAIQTTTRKSLPLAKEIVRTYASMGFNSLFLRPITRLGVAQRRWNQIGYSAEEFIQFYRSGLDEIIKLNHEGVPFTETHASIFLAKMLGHKAQNYMELRSPCGAGVGQMAFTANGNVYTCDEGRMVAQMGDNAFCLGNIYSGGYSDWIESATCRAVCASSLLEGIPQCCDCPFQPYCGVCPVVNYALDGNLVSRMPNNQHCRILKGMITEVIKRLEGPDHDILQRWD